MARVTVEDCLDNLENRFELVLVAAKRARQLAMGSPAHLEWENDKPTVMALREISENFIDASVLNEEDIPSVEEETETNVTAGMSSEAETEVGVLAAQAEDGAESETTEGEVDVAAALAAALAADLGSSMGAMTANNDEDSTED